MAKKRRKPRPTLKLLDDTNNKLKPNEEAALRLQMAGEVMQHMVMAFLAGWLETSMLTLKDEFGFGPEQLAQYMESFKRRWDEQTREATDPTSSTVG